MKFRFRRSLDDNVVPPVTLLLKTEDPLLYRIGAVEDYQDVDEAELNRVLTDALESEYRKIYRVMDLLDTAEFREEKEKALDDLRFDAQEVFTDMMNCGGDMKEMRRLNDAFSEIIKQKHAVELAFSRQNPWLGYYRKLEEKRPDRAFDKGLKGIIVHAAILDPGWFAHPAYPVNKPNSKSLKNALTAQGTPYEEPELKILSFEPVFHFSAERDLLPAKWLNEGSDEK